MKNLILVEFLRRLQTTPSLKKKLKIFVGVALVGLVLSGGLALYLGVVGVKYVASIGSNVDVARHAQVLKSKVEGIPAIAKVECLETVQGLMNIERLLSVPLMDNFQTLKRACFEESIKEPETGKENEYNR